MNKSSLQSKEGLIKSYAFKIFKLKFSVNISENKWHMGEKYKKAPIWFGKVPAVFIWKVALMFDKVKK